MKKTFALLALLFCLPYAYGQNMVEFTVSRPFCLLNFMETMVDGRGTTATLKQIIQQRIPATDTAFKNLVAEYSNIVLDYSYPRQEFPESRRSAIRSTADLIKIAAIQARTIPHFRMRISGILPNSEQTKLCSILTRAEAYYDRVITKEDLLKTKHQVEQLAAYQPAISKAFKAVRNFYNASWANDMPFTVAIFPVRGSHGSSIASAYANTLSMSVYTEEKDYERIAGIVVHEMCHILYDEQPNDVQLHYDSIFKANTSPYMQFAYNFFDEGLATALGNGWIYKQMTGKEDPGEWYTNPYINRFGHVLYPMVTRYMDAGKSIDKPFIDSAIKMFGNVFPKSLTDYGILMNRIRIYADLESEREREQIYASLGQYYQLTYASMNTPISDETNIKYMNEGLATQMIIIDRNHATSLNTAKKIFPEIGNMIKGRKDRNYILSFFDKRKRPVILIYTENNGMIPKAFAALDRQKYIDDKQPYQVF